MNFAPPAKKCSSRTLSPTPGAVLQIGSPQHSTLCYSLCHIAQAQAKSSGGEGIWSAESKVSENRTELTWVFNQPSKLACVCVRVFFPLKVRVISVILSNLYHSKCTREDILFLIIYLIAVDHLCYAKKQQVQQFT